MTPTVLDGGDRRCVLLLIELRKLIATLPPGAVVHLKATDPAAPLDLPAWCHLTGHDYLGEIQPRTYGVRVTASPVETEPSSPWRPAQVHRGIGGSPGPAADSGM
ncbi:tRNA 2-thiouridine synthesizing protein A [Actinoplanes philippinensis]|uniref:tRNA 2-thiouridine synthesizing protein A n=1 Tax=Actinoplanes philippinensis TaxID=35752 RepID=A0A1I2CL73_9ACTN|nr:tRNA 2-thiouridine synthesizing protein A [Actinoplanes philippinensis]